MSAAVIELPREANVKDATVPPLLPVALRPRETSGLISIFTLVIWVGCLAVGIAGFVLPYLRPQPLAKISPPIVAELLNVELTSDPLPPANPAPPPPNLLQPPPLAKPMVVPSAPPMISVAAPSPQIAFAVPVVAPARVVPANEASFRTVETPIVESTPPPLTPQPLTFGQGEGKQPAPEYPRESLRQGQEGTVTVRMTVDEDGRVLAAEVSSSSPWPLLNNAALRVVKSRWRFAPGAVRFYEVPIHFQLSK
jgi:protein TonB